MENKIIIRTASINDLKTVAEVFKNAVKVMCSNGIYQWDEVYPSQEILHNDIMNKQMFLGEIDKNIASVFVLNQECDMEYENGDWEYKESSFFVIHRLCVNPLFQGKGVGKQTVQLIESYLQNKGIETIRLDAFSQNPIALEMYEKLGYKRVGEVNWRKGLFYLFEKKI